MHKENKNKNKDEKKQQEHGSLPSEPMSQLDELSDVWRELLGNGMNEKQLSAFPRNVTIPTLEADPWSALLQAKGVEVVDLQDMHLQISDQEVEQMLQVMPDDLDSRDNSLLGTSEHASSPDVDKQTDK